MAFIPKQALRPSQALFKEMTGDAMENMAKVSLANVDVPSESLVHDNGCGTGAGSHAFLEKQPDISIKATDIDEAVLQMYPYIGAEVLRMDSNALMFSGNTFTHSLANALIFYLPNNGIDAMKEIYRTLRPGGIAIVNSVAYAPNIGPVQRAAARTHPEGTPPPRQGIEQWYDPEFLRSVAESGGFTDFRVSQATYTNKSTASIDNFATMLWSFIGGTSTVGWLESDEKRWDEAIEIIREELKAAKGAKVLNDGVELEFVLNVAIARK